MMNQMLTRRALSSTGDQHSRHRSTRSTPLAEIVAPEGSELASRLRSNGWVARSGWRRQTSGRPAIWLVRFEPSDDCVVSAVA